MQRLRDIYRDKTEIDREGKRVGERENERKKER